MTKYMNRGAPKNEVNIPTGNTMGDIMVLATVSEANNNTAPTTHENGIIYLSLPPITLLIM